MSYSRVIIIGSLTRDPETRYLPSGQALAKFGVAINKKWKGEDGEKKEKVTFVDCTAWGPRAEIIAQYFKKGKAILLEGELEMDQWDDKKTGEKRSKLKVNVTGFSFLPGSGDQQQERTAAAPQRFQKAVASPSPEDEPPPVEEDDVPF